MFELLLSSYLTQKGRLSLKKMNEIAEWVRGVPVLDRSQSSLREEHIATAERLGAAVDAKLAVLVAEYTNTSDTPTDAAADWGTPNFLFFNRLLWENILTEDELAGELDGFEKHYSLEGKDITRNFRDDVEAIFASLINSKDFFANRYLTIALKYILCFAGTHVSFSTGWGTADYSSERMAIQKVVTKNTRYFIGVCGDKTVLHKFDDELKTGFLYDGGGADGNKERYAKLFALINCVTCIFQSMIEQEKEILSLSAPTIYKSCDIHTNENCFIIPLTSKDKRLDIVLGFGEKPNFATISHNL